MTFPGRAYKSGNPTLCEECKEVAIYKGSKVVDGFLRYWYFCRLHGAYAVGINDVSKVEELPEFKLWKRQEKAAAQSRHPSTSLHLFTDETKE